MRILEVEIIERNFFFSLFDFKMESFPEMITSYDIFIKLNKKKLWDCADNNLSKLN